MGYIYTPIILNGQVVASGGSSVWGWVTNYTSDSSSIYCTQYQTVYDAFTSKPDASVAAAQNTMVKTLVDGGVWDKFDLFYCFANNASDNAKINWLSPGNYNCTEPSGNLAFTAYEGFTGGAPAYMNTAFNLSSSAVNYSQNSAAISLYSRTNQSQYAVSAGAYDGTRLVEIALLFSGNMYGNLNTATGSPCALGSPNSLGLLTISRRAAAETEMYNHVTSLGTNTTINSNGVPDSSLFFFAERQSSGIAAFCCTYQISIATVGGALSDADVSILAIAAETYMDSNGKGVK